MKKIVVLIISCLAVLLIFTFGLSKSNYQDSCKRLESIAQDVEKIEYLDKWISTNLSNINFLEYMGKGGLKSMLDNSGSFSLIELDWGYLGIDKQYASLRLNRNFEDIENYLDASTIKSISFGEGRSHIIIKINDSEEFGIEGMDEVKAYMRSFRDDVFVRCR